MERPGVIRIAQWGLAIALAVGIGLTWRFNEIGQNIINLTVCFMFLVGLDNIIIYYRCYVGKSTFQNEATFIIFCLFMLGVIFENFNSSKGNNFFVNKFCYYMVVVVLCINASYYASVILIMLGYLFRQIYRLMTETLLSAPGHISASQFQTLINTKRQYKQLKEQNPTTNDTCPICFSQFSDEGMCIMLPGCGHTFHEECIEEWLRTKQTCPYCRHNIRMEMI